MPHYWFSHWANSRRNVANQRSEADIIQPWPLLPAWHIEINVLPHKAAYSWASPLGGWINWTIFSSFLYLPVYRFRKFINRCRSCDLLPNECGQLSFSLNSSVLLFLSLSLSRDVLCEVWRPRLSHSHSQVWVWERAAVRQTLQVTGRRVTEKKCGQVCCEWDRSVSEKVQFFVSVCCFEIELKNQVSQACQAPLLSLCRHCSTWNTLLDTIKSNWQVCFRRLFVTLTLVPLK